jgi:hypothetical protein
VGDEAAAFLRRNERVILNATLALILAITSGVAGLLWHTNAELAAMQANAGAYVTASSVRNTVVDKRFDQVWQTDKDQYRRLDKQRDEIERNAQGLSSLETRVKALRAR